MFKRLSSSHMAWNESDTPPCGCSGELSFRRMKGSRSIQTLHLPHGNGIFACPILSSKEWLIVVWISSLEHCCVMKYDKKNVNFEPSQQVPKLGLLINYLTYTHQSHDHTPSARPFDCCIDVFYAVGCPGTM